MQKQLLLVTRQSPDWVGLARDFKQGRPIDPDRFRPAESIPSFPENIVELVDLWNMHSPVDFFSCRARLKEIADDTIAQLPDARRISCDELDSFGAEIENFVVFFHDDDDWYSPDLADYLPANSPDSYDVLVFPLVRLWTDTITFVPDGRNARTVVGQRKNFGFRYQSNNYGVNGSLRQQTPLMTMKDHILASAHAEACALRDLYIDQVIGVTAKSPCSASRLSVIFSEPDKAQEHVRAYVDGLAALEIPPEVSWIAERVDSVIELFSR